MFFLSIFVIFFIIFHYFLFWNVFKVCKTDARDLIFFATMLQRSRKTGKANSIMNRSVTLIKELRNSAKILTEIRHKLTSIRKHLTLLVILATLVTSAETALYSREGALQKCCKALPNFANFANFARLAYM